MKKLLFLFISIFFLHTAFSQSWQDALDKLNSYLQTYNGGYYGPVEVKDGIIYIYEAGKSSFNRAEMDKITLAKMEDKDLVIQCVNDENCFYNNFRKFSSLKMFFSTSPKKESLNLLPLMNGFLNSYDKEKGITRATGKEKSATKANIKTAETAPLNESTETGCISGNCKKGFGKFRYENGTTYEGEFKKGQFEGKGTMILSTGEQYTGDFKEGQQTGIAKIIFDNGNVWEGKSHHGNPDGLGKMVYLNGSQYNGIMDRWKKRDGEGTYSLSGGFSAKGTFKDNKAVAVEYFDAANKKITKELFDAQESREIAKANELYKQQHEAKLQQFMRKHQVAAVQNIQVPFLEVNDLSDMSYRSSDIEVVFSNNTAGLFCIKRKANRPSCYDIYEDEITAFSVNSHRRVLSGYAQRVQQNDLGKDVLEAFYKKDSKSNLFKLNYADTNVKQLLADLNYVTAPAGFIMVEGVSENYMIFKDPHREDIIDYGSATYYYVNRKTNRCEKIVNLNTPSDMVWNEDFTRSCLKRTHVLPENLVPDVYKYAYYSIFYLIDWETSTVKHLDDHRVQLHYLSEAIYAKNQSDARWEATRAQREEQSRKDWEAYYESQRKMYENAEKSKASAPKTPKDRHYYYNSVGNKVYVD